MKRTTFPFYLGLLGLFLTSWVGLVAIPYVQAGRLVARSGPRHQVPVARRPQRTGAEQGRAVYAANGCVYCHSQQVRSRADSADIDHGFGARRTVARDYVQDRAAYLGNSRLGPDLSNVGVRHDKADWYYEHEYSPESVRRTARSARRCVSCSTERKIVGQPSTEAVHVAGDDTPARTRRGNHPALRRQGARRLPAFPETQQLQTAGSPGRGRAGQPVEYAVGRSSEL